MTAPIQNPYLDAVQQLRAFDFGFSRRFTGGMSEEERRQWLWGPNAIGPMAANAMTRGT